jgi:predicted DNA-binding transcriptional regulator YafY
MRAQRLLAILMQLQVNRRVTARELAHKLEVSERTILRDMDALSYSGIPVVAGRGAGGGWSLLEEYQTKLTGLTPQEIQSLFVTRTHGLLKDLGLGRTSEAAWTKLQAALPPSAREQAGLVRQRVYIDTRGWRSAEDSAASLPMLLDALWRDRKVRFVYERALGEAGERIVDPLGLVARGSTWYLIANRETEFRTYRISRIRSVEVLDAPVQRPPGFDLAAHWEQSAVDFREKLPQYRATFLARPTVMRWIRYRGWRLEEEKPEGDLRRIRIRFDAEEEALQFALSLGADVEIVEPTPLRAKVREAALGLVGLYRKSSGRAAHRTAPSRRTRKRDVR